MSFEGIIHILPISAEFLSLSPIFLWLIVDLVAAGSQRDKMAEYNVEYGRITRQREL